MVKITSEHTIEDVLQLMLNKVNKVTARHRHGMDIPDQYLFELSERQLDVEEFLRKHNEGKEGDINE